MRLLLLPPPPLLPLVDLASLLVLNSSLGLVPMTESAPVDAVDSGLESALVLSLLWSVMVDVVSVTQPPMTMLLAVFVARHDDPLSSDLPTEYRLLKLMDFGRNSMTTTAYSGVRTGEVLKWPKE